MKHAAILTLTLIVALWIIVTELFFFLMDLGMLCYHLAFNVMLSFSFLLKVALQFYKL